MNKKSLLNFLKDKSGNVTMIFGLSAIPLMLAAGAAIEYSNMLDAKTKLQTAVDSAALAAAAQYGNGATNWADTAKKYVETNKPESMSKTPLTVNVTVNSTDLTMKVKATGKVKTAFGNVLNINAGQGSAENQSQTPAPDTVTSESVVALPIFSDFHKGEIALVVDYSWSMNSTVGGTQKYVSMRNQVANLLNQLSQNGNNNDVKFGLVPFSESVRVTMPRGYFRGYSGTTSMTACIEDRRNPYNTNSTTPTSTNSTKWAVSSEANCSTYSSRSVNVRPLTTSHAGTISQVNAMTPIGNTHISLGMEMAYHMLTPNAPFTEATAMGASDTLKAVVLLTDGAQTTGGWGPSSAWGVPQAEANLTTICENMKTAGIRVVTVSFDLADASNASSEARLQNCASGPEYYFNVETNAQLANAFGTIKNQLARNMYITK